MTTIKTKIVTMQKMNKKYKKYKKAFKFLPITVCLLYNNTKNHFIVLNFGCVSCLLFSLFPMMVDITIRLLQFTL